VGPGAVIVVLVPHLIGRDERAHPCIPYLLNGLTEGLLPISVRLADGRRPQGEVAWQINRTRDGYLILLINPKGIDKTQNGIARVDRRAFVDVVLHTTLPIQSAQEMTRAFPLHREQAKGQTRVRLRIPAGDLAVVALQLAPARTANSPQYPKVYDGSWNDKLPEIKNRCEGGVTRYSHPCHRANPSISYPVFLITSRYREDRPPRGSELLARSSARCRWLRCGCCHLPDRPGCLLD
jgi:hypothetical protein